MSEHNMHGCYECCLAVGLIYQQDRMCEIQMAYFVVSNNNMIKPFKRNTVSYKMNHSPSYEFPQSTLEMQPYRLSYVWRYVWSSSLNSPHQVS